MSAIKKRFEQPCFIVYKNFESLLIDFLHDEDVSSQISFVTENYAEDIKCDYLLPQLEIFKVLMRGRKAERFADVLDAVKSFAPNQQAMISEVVRICKLLHVRPATSANRERSFSMAPELKEANQMLCVQTVLQFLK